MTATCTNETCEREGAPIPVAAGLLRQIEVDGELVLEPVICGACHEPCELEDGEVDGDG